MKQKEKKEAEEAEMESFTLRYVSLQPEVNDDDETYLSKMGTGPLRAGGYCRLLEENAKGRLQKKRKHKIIR